MYNTGSTSKLYKRVAAAGLLASLVLGGSGCCFEGFSLGLFSFRKRHEPKKEVPIMPVVPIGINESLCLERSLADYAENKESNDAPGVEPIYSEEEQVRRFNDEYGAVNQDNPIQGMKVSGSISIAF